ncbi:phage tail protein X [Sporomusaceae bacterium BoRhaA]|uniref:tail protein X n=1 Tax=Pelorhabdus rhamnosifermentans TaxID=2772457 RepID=UPI001C063F5F|nr:tail protein X [Pelorhabdus rhamnosifermentans]MBU2701690.1 phage tail protein X [Pelorhabdus rhamnosifermentans]
MATDTYTTKQGDMWDMIAFKVYGDEYKMHYLMDANKEHVETVIFPAGITLMVPTLSTSQKTNLPPWKQEFS